MKIRPFGMEVIGRQLLGSHFSQMLYDKSHILVLFLTFSEFIFITSCNADKEPDESFSVSYIERNGDEHPLKLTVYNSKTNSKIAGSAPYESAIRIMWCDKESLKHPPMPFQEPRSSLLKLDMTTVPEISDMMQDLGVSVSVGAGPESCFPSGDLVTLSGSIYRPAPSPTMSQEDIVYFYCLYNTSNKTLTFVDSANASDVPSWVWTYPSFDDSGKYLYYRKSGIALEYNIKSRKISTLPGGDYPLVAWNRPGIIIYNSKDESFCLLDSTKRVRSIIKGRLKGRLVLSTFGLDEDTFIFGVLDVDAFGIRDFTRFSVLNFHTGSMFELFQHNGQNTIASAVRLK